jgi:2-phospho-L-lactate guanylyltransferase
MDTPEVARSAAAVVALKPTAYAKSRLELPDPIRRRLAWTMALDTLRALSAAVAEVLVVSDQNALSSRLHRAGLQLGVLPEAGRTGMNAALAYGAEQLRAAGHSTVLACVGDLPALRADSVAQVLSAAQHHPRAFVADATGIGTTMLAATGTDLEPRFQGRSAAAHRASGAVALTELELGGPVADARRDVDNEVDLATAAAIGLGPNTAALIDPETGRLGRYEVITATSWADASGTPLAVTATGHRIALPATSFADGLRHARLGQRLHAVVTDDRVLSAWL